LIPYLGENKKPTPYYITVDRVWNNLYDVFPESLAGKSAFAGYDLPVLGVDFELARKFAQWLGGTSGHLPLTSQWDTAAGRYEDAKGEGPFRGLLADIKGDDVGLNRSMPIPVGKALKDRTFLGCHDMAGNGLEWTRNYKVITEPDQKEIGGTGSKVPLQARVLLRGRDFHEPEPLLWDDLLSPESIPFYAAERKDPGYLARVGFRVVIELHGN
jgi:formylglycine-generating enzyme required for sulfatase activity